MNCQLVLHVREPAAGAQAAQAQGGLEALLAGGPGGGNGNSDGGEEEGDESSDPLLMPGRFLHLRADELRMREASTVQCIATVHF